MKRTNIVSQLLAVGFVLTYSYGSSVAQESIAVKIEEVTCKDLLLMYDDQEATLVFFHGFMSGKKGEMVYDDKELTESTDKILNHCIENPADSVLSAFEKFR